MHVPAVAVRRLPHAPRSLFCLAGTCQKPHSTFRHVSRVFWCWTGTSAHECWGQIRDEFLPRRKELPCPHGSRCIFRLVVGRELSNCWERVEASQRGKGQVVQGLPTGRGACCHPRVSGKSRTHSKGARVWGEDVEGQGTWGGRGHEQELESRRPETNHPHTSPVGLYLSLSFMCLVSWTTLLFSLRPFCEVVRLYMVSCVCICLLLFYHLWSPPQG